MEDIAGQTLEVGDFVAYHKPRREYSDFSVQRVLGFTKKRVRIGTIPKNRYKQLTVSTCLAKLHNQDESYYERLVNGYK